MCGSGCRLAADYLRAVSDDALICCLGSVSLSLAISYTFCVFFASANLYEYRPIYRIYFCACCSFLCFRAIYSSQFRRFIFVHINECEKPHNIPEYDAKNAKKACVRMNPNAGIVHIFDLGKRDMRIRKLNSFGIKAGLYRPIERIFQLKR